MSHSNAIRGSHGSASGTSVFWACAVASTGCIAALHGTRWQPIHHASSGQWERTWQIPASSLLRTSTASWSFHLQRACHFHPAGSCIQAYIQLRSSQMICGSFIADSDNSRHRKPTGWQLGLTSSSYACKDVQSGPFMSGLPLCSTMRLCSTFQMRFASTGLWKHFGDTSKF